MKFLVATAVALLATSAMPADAAEITYTFDANITGTLNGGQFTNYAATFTGVGNTNNTTGAFGYPASQILGVPLTSLTLTSFSTGSGSFQVTSPSFFYIYNPPVSGAQNTRLGLGFDSSGSNALGLESAAFNGYSGLTSFPTTSAPDYFRTASFTTDRGDVTITGFSNATFGAVAAAAPGAVPEPATWGMMIIGFGVMGTAVRRRAKVQTKVSFA